MNNIICATTRSAKTTVVNSKAFVHRYSVFECSTKASVVPYVKAINLSVSPDHVPVKFSLSRKSYSQKKEKLLQAKTNAEEILRYKSVDMVDPQVVQDYTDDLRNLLAKSSITEQRSFLKSFLQRI